MVNEQEFQDILLTMMTKPNSQELNEKIAKATGQKVSAKKKA